MNTKMTAGQFLNNIQNATIESTLYSIKSVVNDGGTRTEKKVANAEYEVILKNDDMFIRFDANVSVFFDKIDEYEDLSDNVFVYFSMDETNVDITDTTFDKSMFISSVCGNMVREQVKNDVLDIIYETIELAA